MANKISNQAPLRMCVTCRKMLPRTSFFRLTVDSETSTVMLDSKTTKVSGRSAYLCQDKHCVEPALKGHRLKISLTGRAKRGAKNRIINWPLEAQLIHSLSTIYTEVAKTCQNTQEKESNA